MENIKIAIINESFIINRGLQLIINRIRGIDISIICNNWVELETYIKKDDIDIILINNSNFSNNKDIQKAYKTKLDIHWAMLKIDNTEINSMYNFEFIISINEAEADIIKKLEHFVEKGNHNANTNSSRFELSEREKEILRHVALGLTNSEIAEKLFISQHTVIAHRKNITSKLSIKTISGLTVYALLNDLISMSDVNKII